MVREHVQFPTFMNKIDIEYLISGNFLILLKNKKK